jgi:hypothetical protein
MPETKEKKMGANKLVKMNLNNVSLQYPQRITMTEFNAGVYPKYTPLEVGAVVAGSADPVLKANLDGTAFAVKSSTDGSIYTMRILSNLTLKDKNGQAVLKMSHSDERITINLDTDEYTANKLDSLFIKPGFPVDFGSSGLTSTHQINYISLEIAKAQDTSKLLVMDASGFAILYLAQDEFSTFSVESKITPINQSDVNRIGAVLVGRRLSGGDVYSSYAVWDVSGSGVVRMAASGTIEHL